VCIPSTAVDTPMSPGCLYLWMYIFVLSVDRLSWNRRYMGKTNNNYLYRSAPKWAFILQSLDGRDGHHGAIVSPHTWDSMNVFFVQATISLSRRKETQQDTINDQSLPSNHCRHSCIWRQQLILLLPTYRNTLGIKLKD